jgi:deazaflavin-dependent oxidoreductase (nitroreductase family)
MEDAHNYLYLTTTGWKSGKPHEIEIWYVSYEGAYYLVSEWREKSHWVQNIQGNPAVSFRVGDQNFQGKGRVIDNEAEPALAAAVSAKMDTKYEWSDGLIVELRPD